MLKLYAQNNPIQRLEQIVSVLNDGGVIIYPTGTTYAIGCHALKERAVERICKLKQLDPREHPLSIVCYDLSAISQYAHISTSVYKVLKRNLPGSFTFILQGKRVLPKIFRFRKNGELGIRMPDCNILNEILEHLNAPMITASLPIGEDFKEVEYQIDPELINEAYGDVVDLIIDGGIGKMGLTTIVDCQNDELQIIRQGDGVLV